MNPAYNLIDNIYEAKILEDLRTLYTRTEFDQAAEKYHALLKKPFKHPPLQHASQFGKKNERDIWYGSYEQLTALTESAYYQFYFLLGSKGIFPQIRNPCTATKIGIKTARGITLCQDPFLSHRSHIASSVDYSARHTNGSNVRVFEARAFTAKEPIIIAWICKGNETELIYFQSYNLNKLYRFFKKDFLVDNHFPPAN